MIRLRCIAVLSPIIALMLAQTASAAPSCNGDGVSETVIKPAELEFETVKSLVYISNNSSELITIPAVHQIMDVADYEKLPAKMSYNYGVCKEAVLATEPVSFPIGRISDYDVIKLEDGTEYMRPLDPSIHALNRKVIRQKIISEATVETVVKTKLRPEPEVLPNGQLRVLMSPPVIVGRCIPPITKEVTRRYATSRKPATIQLTSCNVPQQEIGK